MTPPIPVAIGIGCQRGTALETLEGAVTEALSGLGSVEVRCIATHARKAGEPALLALAERHGCPFLTYPAERLDAVGVPNPSMQVAEEMGTASVCEAAVLLATNGGELLVEKRTHLGADGKSVTIAVAYWPAAGANESDRGPRAGTYSG